jgi:hypothetical protein
MMYFVTESSSPMYLRQSSCQSMQSPENTDQRST